MLNKKIQTNVCDCSGLVELTKQTTVEQLNVLLLQTVGEILPGSLISFSKDCNILGNVTLNKRFLGLLIENEALEEIVESKSIPLEVVNELDSLIKVYINQSNMIGNINNDQLTKLGNRQALDAKFTDIFGISGRRKEEADYCLAILDIDLFKQVNDTFGHLHGDEILLQLSRLMIKTFRDIDFLFRFGGEEFVVILSDIQLAEASKVLERFRETVSLHDFPLVKAVTVSIGLTQLRQSSNAMETIEKADKALYYAKENGRNQLRMYEDLIDSGDLKETNVLKDDITLF